MRPPNRSDRLRWQRGPSPHSFVAYPLGNGWREVCASLWHGPSQGHADEGWHWIVQFLHWAKASGFSRYRRLAVEAANHAWPIVRAEGEANRAAAQARQRLAYEIDRLVRKRVVSLADFGIDTQSDQQLLFIVRECRQRWEPRYKLGQECRALEALMMAASEELYRRRVGSHE